ncbi:MAG: NfeD family protein [Candidatus Babeliales bacterium]|jgi:membrane protein implicated in regulation of membrane protease activity
MTHIWFILALFWLFLEMGNPGLFYFLSIAFGSFMAFVASLYNLDIAAQCTICLTGSLGMLFLLQTYVKKSQKNKSSKMYQSNMYQLIGKTIEITEITSATSGYGKINGETWSVKSQGNKSLTVGMLAIITGVQGCHLQINSLANDSLSNDSLIND